MPLILRFSIPLVLGSLFQQLYNFADTAIVGRFISVDALSAVGVTSSLNFLVFGLTMGSAIGFCIPLAQGVGAGDQEEVRRFFWNGLYLSIALSVAVCAAALALLRPMLLGIHTPDELLDMAEQYLRVILLGQAASVLYNYFAGVLRAFGDSKSPFYFLVISCVINVGLDLLLIRTFSMGVVGAAVATVTSQAISALLCAWQLFGRSKALSAAGREVSFLHMKKAAAVGIPMGLEYSVTSIGSIVLQGAINTLGSTAVAAQICGEKIRTIATLPMESVGMAMATYTGQNYGAKRMDRVRAGIRSGLIIQASYCIVAWLALFLLKRPLVAVLLGDGSPAETQASLQYLSVISTLFLFHGSLMVFRNVIQGMGYGVRAMFSGLMEVAGRIGAGLAAVKFDSFLLIALANPLAWIFALLYCMAAAWLLLRRQKQYGQKL